MVRSLRASFLGASLACAVLPIVCMSVVVTARAATGASPGSVEIDRDRPIATPQAGEVAMATEVDPERRGGGSTRLLQLDRQLAEVEALLTAAHFYTALARARATRDRLDTFGAHPRFASRRARLEVMAATGEVALGQRARALQSMLRALRVDPGLSLDERETSPKVLRLLWDARRRLGAEVTP